MFFSKFYYKSRILTLFFANSLFFFYFSNGYEFAHIWFPRFMCFFLAILTILSIYILGSCLSYLFYNKENTLLYTLLNFALGTFLFCIITFVLGSLGLLSRSTSLIILLMVNSLGWKKIFKLFQNFKKILEFLIKQDLVTKVLLSFLIILIALNLLLSFIPPLDYDVLEYHLGTPAQYNKEGKIIFLPNNMYANFPQNMEMIAFFHMRLIGKYYGALSSKLILWLYGILLILSCYSLAKTFVSEKEALFGALLVYLLPWTTKLIRIYYVEIPMTFFLILAIILFKNSKNEDKKAHYILIGLLIGIASGFKYTVIFIGIFAYIPFLIELPGNFQKRFQYFLLIGIGCIITFSPWLCRNYINTGNPIYPLFNNIIIPNYWFNWMYARFRQAHAPLSIEPAYLGKLLLKAFFTGSYVSLIHLSLLIPSLFALAKQKFRTIALFIFIWVSIWMIFTHQIERFIYIVFVLLCIPMGYILSKSVKEIPNKILMAALLIILLSCYLYQHCSLTISGAYDYLFGFINRNTLLSRHYLPYKAETFINDKINKKILMIGEARNFYLDVPVIYNTVFDYNLLEYLFINNNYNIKKIINDLKKKNIIYLYFNWNEVARLQKTYSFKYKYTENNQYKEKELPGCLWINDKQLKLFLKNHCEKIFSLPKIAIYKLK